MQQGHHRPSLAPVFVFEPTEICRWRVTHQAARKTYLLVDPRELRHNKGDKGKEGENFGNFLFYFNLQFILPRVLELQESTGASMIPPSLPQKATLWSWRPSVHSWTRSRGKQFANKSVFLPNDWQRQGAREMTQENGMR